MKRKILYIVITLLFLILCYVSTAQSNSYKKILEYKSQQHKQTLEDIENKKYQMVYIDRTLYIRRNKKMYLYSSYDLSNGEECGLGVVIGLVKLKKKKIIKRVL